MKSDDRNKLSWIVNSESIICVRIYKAFFMKIVKAKVTLASVIIPWGFFSGNTIVIVIITLSVYVLISENIKDLFKYAYW